MNNNEENTKELFEGRLLYFIKQAPGMHGSLDKVAEELEAFTGKVWHPKKMHFMIKGEGYAKKWQLCALLEYCLQHGWMPETLTDWMHITWTITGKKQSVQGGYNGDIYRKLADMANKAEFIFEDNYNRIMDKSYEER